MDPNRISQLLNDALERPQFGSNATPPPISSNISEWMAQRGITPLPPPTNAFSICAALGRPGMDNAASSGLTAILSQFRRAPDEFGFAVGLVVSAIFSSCHDWMPYVDDALSGL
jgi:hypothetical protein